MAEGIEEAPLGRGHRGVAGDRASATSFTRDEQGVLLGMRTPGGRYYYLYDGLGNVAAVTDSSGNVVATYRYSAYGETLASTGTLSNPSRFGGSYGAYTDVSTGLLKIGQRFYDPALGRWTQPDPRLNLQDPLQWNRYGYVSGNPVNFIDPTGLALTCSQAFGWIGMGLGLVGLAIIFASAGTATPVAASAYTYYGALVAEASLLAGAVSLLGCPS